MYDLLHRQQRRGPVGADRRQAPPVAVTAACADRGRTPAVRRAEGAERHQPGGAAGPGAGRGRPERRREDHPARHRGRRAAARPGPGPPGRPRCHHGLGRATGPGSGSGRTYQVPRPFGSMTVFENALVAAVRGAGLRRQAAYQAAYAALARTGLAAKANVARAPADPARAQAAGAGPGAGHPAIRAAAGRDRRRPDRAGDRCADRHHPGGARGGHHHRLGGAHHARADPGGGAGRLPGRRPAAVRRHARPDAGDPEVQRAYLGGSVG